MLERQGVLQGYGLSRDANDFKLLGFTLGEHVTCGCYDTLVSGLPVTDVVLKNKGSFLYIIYTTGQQYDSI